VLAPNYHVPLPTNRKVEEPGIKRYELAALTYVRQRLSSPYKKISLIRIVYVSSLASVPLTRFTTPALRLPLISINFNSAVAIRAAPKRKRDRIRGSRANCITPGTAGVGGQERVRTCLGSRLL
jgi:hypothetical protein